MFVQEAIKIRNPNKLTRCWSISTALSGKRFSQCESQGIDTRPASFVFFHCRLFSWIKRRLILIFSDDFYLLVYLTRRKKTLVRNGIIWLNFCACGKINVCGSCIDPSATQLCCFDCPGYMLLCLTSWQFVWIPKKKGFFKYVEISTFPLICRKNKICTRTPQGILISCISSRENKWTRT